MEGIKKVAKVAKVAIIYECKICDYKCSKKFNLNKHIDTSKHLKNAKKQQNDIIDDKKVAKVAKVAKPSEFTCFCNKTFKHNSGLWRHKKKYHSEENIKICNTNNENSDVKILAELFKMQMNENKELKELIIEQNKQMIEQNKTILELSGKSGNTNCNNNTNNNFNLQFFLNEQCKDALNLVDFVNQIKLQLSDLDMIGRVGYVEGMSKIFLRNLNELDIFKRPIHCSDLKRETLYVKDKDSWEKENTENVKIKRAIKEIEHKNIKQIPQWREENPTAEDTETKKHLEYQNILLEAMGGSTLEDDNKKREKIIRNIAKEVVIDKNK
jgi:hypothetical protein